MSQQRSFPTLMITGLGNLGSHVLDMITKLPNHPSKIILVGRDADLLLRKRNMALLTASQFGFYPQIVFEVSDLDNVSQLSEIIKKHSPDVIFNAASIQSWRKVTELPKEIYKEMDKAAFGPWLPMHLPLVYNLSKAIRETGLTPLFINAAYPDAVNPTLHKIGLSPSVGIGNIANAVPGLKYALSEHLLRPVKHIELKFIAHHYISHHVSRHGFPRPDLFHLSVFVDGRDVTDSLDLKQVFDDVPTKFKRLVGVEGQPMTATSAIKVIMAALHDTNELMHAPGPNGHPGGYPVRVGSKKVSIDLPSKMDLSQAVKINEESQNLEGISRIEEDGTVHFRSENMQIMKKMLGYECQKMKIEESFAFAQELKQKYREFARRYACS